MADSTGHIEGRVKLRPMMLIDGGLGNLVATTQYHEPTTVLSYDRFALNHNQLRELGEFDDDSEVARLIGCVNREEQGGYIISLLEGDDQFRSRRFPSEMINPNLHLEYNDWMIIDFGTKNEKPHTYFQYMAQFRF
jgi:hypothetical protein